VHRQIAANAGADVSTYPTLPAFDVAATLSSADDALLVTAPFSPLGRDLTSDEVAALEAWLREHPDRLLVWNRVYG
jgi:hypothetical protein